MREKGHNPRLFRRLPSVAFHARHVFPFSPGPDLLPKPAIDFNFQKSRRHIFFDLCNAYEGDDIIVCVCVTTPSSAFTSSLTPQFSPLSLSLSYLYLPTTRAPRTSLLLPQARHQPSAQQEERNKHPFCALTWPRSHLLKFH